MLRCCYMPASTPPPTSCWRRALAYTGTHPNHHWLTQPSVAVAEPSLGATRVAGEDQWAALRARDRRLKPLPRLRPLRCAPALTRAALPAASHVSCRGLTQTIAVGPTQTRARAGIEGCIHWPWSGTPRLAASAPRTTCPSTRCTCGWAMPTCWGAPSGATADGSVRCKDSSRLSACFLSERNSAPRNAGADDQRHNGRGGARSFNRSNPVASLSSFAARVPLGKNRTLFVLSDTDEVLRVAEALGMRTARHVGRAVHMGIESLRAQAGGNALANGDVARLMLDWWMLVRAKAVYYYAASMMVMTARATHVGAGSWTAEELDRTAGVEERHEVIE
eukprot:1206363-Prymnesium_polylepis.2